MNYCISMSTNNIYENLEDDEERSVDSQSGDISGLFAPDKEVEEEEERQEVVIGGVNSAGFLDHASGQGVSIFSIPEGDASKTIVKKQDGDEKPPRAGGTGGGGGIYGDVDILGRRSANSFQPKILPKGSRAREGVMSRREIDSSDKSTLADTLPSSTLSSVPELGQRTKVVGHSGVPSRPGGVQDLTHRYTTVHHQVSNYRPTEPTGEEDLLHLPLAKKEVPENPMHNEGVDELEWEEDSVATEDDPRSMTRQDWLRREWLPC